jgi:hypothetical protein
MRRIGGIIMAVLVAIGGAGCADAVREDPYAQPLVPGEGTLALPVSTLGALTPHRAETATMPTWREERYQYPAGFVEYEHQTGPAFYAETVEGPSYRALFLGVSVAGEAVPAHALEPRHSGTVSHAPVEVAGQPCLTFRRTLGPVVARGRQALAIGVLCRPASESMAKDAFLDAALAYVQGMAAR